MELYIVPGGIGKQIMFTSILNKLPKKICISSYWNKVFNNHPMVEAVYPDYGWGSYDMAKYYKQFKKIIYVEPYYGEFLKGEMHLIEAYHEKLNLKCDGLYNTVTFSEEELHYYSKFIGELEDYILVQFTGSDREAGKELDTLFSRNTPFNIAQDVINILSKDLNKKVIEVNSGSPQYENTYIPRKIPEYRDYLIMTKYCKSFISIDSCLNHMSAFKENPKKGVCLWRDREYGKLFEYPHNTNLYSELPLQMKFNAQSVVDELMIAMDFNKNR